jgi:NADH:ubiquinone oxidoreductase subunit F (NADH-binding)/Pyruvate/2-oxoacid:ferredoxin oxidoreductase delta subunit/(2Fe-2S) ferredoxin
MIKMANTKNSNGKSTKGDYYSKIKPTPEQIKEFTHTANTKPLIFIGMGTCGLAGGSQATYSRFVSELQKYNIDADIISVGCIGCCWAEPIVDIKLPGKSRLVYSKVTEDKVVDIIQNTLQQQKVIPELVMGQYKSQSDENFPDIPDISEHPFFVKQKKFVLSRCGVINPESLEEYFVYEDGYKALATVLEENDPIKVIEEIKASGLRGRGGAGFPTGTKWEMAYQSKSPDGKKFIIMNADEGDPGAFMDRSVLESDPFSALEGMAIAGFAIGAQKGYIYCRAEYPLAIRNLQTAIKIARKRNLLGDNILGSQFSFDLEIKKGAGAFVCGEETALIESIEGKRGMPRIKPPYPSTYGLFGRPTCVNNVETICQVAKILNYGAKEFAKIGTEKSKGTKVFALTGKIAKAGLVEVPMGTTIKEIIDIGGGIANGKKYKAAQIGGPSGGCIPRNLINTTVDYESLKAVGAMMGSGGLVIMDEDTCMVDTARYFMNFIQEESCGKCIPCREGTKRMLETLEKLVVKPKNDEDVINRMKSILYLERLAHVIQDSALCGLGMSAPNPVLSTLKYFRDEYEAHLYEDKCPSKYCGGLLQYKIDVKKCVGCGLCKLNCPNDAIMGEKKAPHYIVEERCIKCGMCKSNCKFDAVNVD